MVLKNAYTILLNKLIQYNLKNFPEEVIKYIFEYIYSSNNVDENISCFRMDNTNGIVIPHYPKLLQYISYHLENPPEMKKVAVRQETRRKYPSSNYHLVYRINDETIYYKNISNQTYNIMLYKNKHYYYYYNNIVVLKDYYEIDDDILTYEEIMVFIL